MDQLWDPLKGSPVGSVLGCTIETIPNASSLVNGAELEDICLFVHSKLTTPFNAMMNVPMKSNKVEKTVRWAVRNLIRTMRARNERRAIRGHRKTSDLCELLETIPAQIFLEVPATDLARFL